MSRSIRRAGGTGRFIRPGLAVFASVAVTLVAASAAPAAGTSWQNCSHSHTVIAHGVFTYSITNVRHKVTGKDKVCKRIATALKHAEDQMPGGPNYRWGHYSPWDFWHILRGVAAKYDSWYLDLHHKSEKAVGNNCQVDTWGPALTSGDSPEKVGPVRLLYTFRDKNCSKD